MACTGRLLHGCLAAASAVALCAALIGSPSASANRAAAFPDPGGSNTAKVDLADLGRKLVGVNDDYQSWVYPHADSLGKLAAAGFSAARRTLAWSSVEPIAGVWDLGYWREADSYYRTALGLGIEPVFVLGFAPVWAWSPDDLLLCPQGTCQMPPGPSMDGAWQRFAAEAARRFPLASFEIWNEPNTSAFWASGPDPERWAELVKAASAAIRASSADARVIAGGLAGITTQSSSVVGLNGEMKAGDFLAQALAAPAAVAGDFDAVSLHFFPQSYWPFVPFEFGAGSHLAELFKEVRGALQSTGLAGTPLWFDEVGYWTADPGAPQYAVSEQQAADGLTKLVRRLLSIDDVEAVLVHRAIDAPSANGANRFQIRNSTFGLMRRDAELTAKPAYCALAAMSSEWVRTPECPLPSPEPAPGSPTPSPTPPAPPEPAPAPPRVGEPAPGAQSAVDSVAPEIVSLRRMSGNRFRVHARDRGVGLAGVQIARERIGRAQAWRAWSGERMTLKLAAAPQRLHLRVRDRAGNRSKWLSRTLGRFRPRSST